jgi:hypothetical protein
MTNSKRKCSYKPCSLHFRHNEGIVEGVNAWCSEPHKIQWAIEAGKKLRLKTARAEKKASVVRKREFYETDIKTRREAAIKWFNRYILIRDRDAGCITCGTRKPSIAYHAGHYVNAGTCSATRFDERNVWKQCARCNLFLSGAKDRYRIALCDKIGTSVVEMLEGPQATIKTTAEWYQGIEDKYKQLCKNTGAKAA